MHVEGDRLAPPRDVVAAGRGLGDRFDLSRVRPVALGAAGLFAVLSALYAVFVFPWHQMDTYSRQQLMTIGKGLDRAYLPFDSGGYLDSARGSLGAVLHGFVEVSGLHFGLFSNVALQVIGYAALWISPRHPYELIAGLNYLLLVWTALHYRAVVRRYAVDYGRFLPLLLLNPLLLFSLWTLNKEALGLFLVAGLLRYRLEEKWVRFAILLILSLYTRNIFFLYGLVLLLLPLFHDVRLRGRRFRVSAIHLLVGASLVVPLGLYVTHDQPFGSEFGPLDLVAKQFHQQTQRLLSFAYRIERFPFGYLIAYPIVTGINIASPALNYKYWEGYGHVINVATLTLQLSSLIFVGLLLLAYRSRPWLGLFAIEPLRLFFIVTLITSVYPISQHRYLLPFYPLLVLTYLIAAGRKADGADRVLDRAPLGRLETSPSRSTSR